VFEDCIDDDQNVLAEEMEERTVVDAVGAPLAFRNLPEYRGACPCSSSTIPSLGFFLRFSKAC
jgi:hypothetical protein